MAGSRFFELSSALSLSLLIVPVVVALPGLPQHPTTQSLYGQCGGIGYKGASTCQSTATCSTQNPYYAQCVAPKTTSASLYSTTITSGGTAFTTTITTSSRTIHEVVSPVGTKTFTTTIPANAAPFTFTIKATGFSSGTVIVGTPSSKTSSISSRITSSSSSPLLSTSPKSSSSSSSSTIVPSSPLSSKTTSSAVSSVTSSVPVAVSTSSSINSTPSTLATISSGKAAAATSTKATTTPFVLYTASVCASGSTSAAAAPTAPAKASCDVSSGAVSPNQLLQGSPFHVIDDPSYCAQLCLNTDSCQSFAFNELSGSATSDCYLYNSTTVTQNLANAKSTTAITGNVTYFDSVCYSCASSAFPSISSACDPSSVGLPCLQALYQFPLGMLSVDSVSMGILELGNNVYEQDALDSFAAKYRPNDVPAGWAPVLNSINGGSLNGGDSPETIESDVDFEWALNVVYPQNITLYQVGTPDQSGSFGNFLDAVDASYCGGDDPRWDPQYSGGNTCGAFAATQVISSSYAGNEASYSTNVDANGNLYLTDYYPQRQCMEYMKLGLMGTTVLFSSGDNGAAGESGWCPAFGPADDYNNGYYYQQDTDGYYAPQFPGSCPYVTSVGATQLSDAGGLPEVAATWTGDYGEQVGSSGGFSNVFAAPSYQQSALATYWSSGLAPDDSNGPWTNISPDGYPRYNNSQTTRGQPDIAANGKNWDLFWGGSEGYSWGTSLSTPLMGSLFTLINQERALIGKGPVGFVNPVLYANPGIFNDVTSGCTGGCGTTGFCAVPGWDPVTGLGTPNYPQLLQLFLSLP